MDGHSSYNQISMAIEDVHKMTFCCPRDLGIYKWLVMSLGLKNIGATYQRAKNLVFHDDIGKKMEVYIDDVVVKSIDKDQQLGVWSKIYKKRDFMG